ncbi:cell division protein FtsQ/DivIB [Calidifontibacillus oryziterrae]|uniref:cell division protein FtsQ/DivIB n=1 Tax=Calidifontibacillus oryziterrae TaxID=1191699 RepID=UPI0002F1AD32|nr:FtsQ-type POTRA domain-containing protein [Calidifontibacillus oryziterrae]
MKKGKVIAIEDRIPKLKQQRKEKANRRLILYSSLFFVLVLFVLYFQSPLSKVQSINVTGNVHVTADEIRKLSHIDIGTSFWKVQVDKIVERIQAHNQIANVKVSRHFPNHINIKVYEYKRVAYLVDGSSFYPILETGKMLTEGKLSEIPADAPLLMNWKQSEVLQEMAAQLRKVPVSVLNRISEIHLTPDNIDPLHLTLYMSDGHEVSATVRDFAKKISNYPSIVEKLSDEHFGVIHLEVGSYFRAYEKAGDEESESER